MATNLGGLIDAENGLISRRIFIEPEIYEQESERIFARCWLFLCHESQIPQPGDFLATYMGEDRVLVVRDSGGRVHAFLNLCSHRGNRSCRADTGNSAIKSGFSFGASTKPEAAGRTSPPVTAMQVCVDPTI